MCFLKIVVWVKNATLVNRKWHKDKQRCCFPAGHEQRPPCWKPFFPNRTFSDISSFQCLYTVHGLAFRNLSSLLGDFFFLEHRLTFLLADPSSPIQMQLKKCFPLQRDFLFEMQFWMNLVCCSETAPLLMLGHICMFCIRHNLGRVHRATLTRYCSLSAFIKPLLEKLNSRESNLTFLARLLLIDQLPLSLKLRLWAITFHWKCTHNDVLID